MIDKAKQYETRDGRPVRIYATDHAGEYPVHGAMQNEDGGWNDESWTQNGRYFLHDIEDHGRDLVEVRPQYTRWLVVKDETGGYATRQEAVDRILQCNIKNCSVVQVTWREGDGLAQ